MRYDKLELPNGKLVTAKEILAGVAILEIAAPDDLKINTKLLKYVRVISETKKVDKIRLLKEPKSI